MLAAFSCAAAESFYVDPNSNGAIWVRNNVQDWRAADIQEHIAKKAAARWFGNWSGDIAVAVDKYVSAAATLRQTPILVAYNIPGRDCGQHSSGGAASMLAYKQWIAGFVTGIGSRKAVVVLEPDALPHLDCLSADGKAARLDLLRYAAGEFRQRAPHAFLYLDIGHSEWLSVAQAASRLMAAGVADARGFSLNVSNYKTTESNTVYGNAVAAELRHNGMTKTFAIDTSRNGNGPYGSLWCDPPGRKIGPASVENTSGEGAEMTLWIKYPGNADGCAAPAGSFSPELAHKLIFGY